MLRIGGFINIIIAIAHVIGLFWANQMFELTGIGNEMKELFEIHTTLPYLMTFFVSIIFFVFGLYGLSADNRIRKLPFLKTGIFVIAGIYILRGLGELIFDTLLKSNSVSESVFSLFALTVGVLYLIGGLKKWNNLKFPMKNKIIIHLVLVTILASCKNDNEDMPEANCTAKNYFSEYSTRNFEMGFSTWSFGPNLQDVEDTYQFIDTNADMYSEHIDDKIPWNAWMNNLPLPIEFLDEIESRTSKIIENKKLLLSISLLNSDRSELAEDFDETIPIYTSLNDIEIEEAYFLS